MSSGADKIVLFETASKQDNKSWSLNPWKTRMLLNFKGLDYETKFLEYPEIKPTLEAHVERNPSTNTYTIPTIKFPDGTYVSDSRVIVTEIEKRYPYLSVHLDSPLLSQVEDLTTSTQKALAPCILPKVPVRILNEASQPYWHETRIPRFDGRPLADIERDLGGDVAYDDARPHITAVTELLRKASVEGPFFEGSKVTYADFVWVGFLIMCRRLGDDVYDRVVGDHKDIHDRLLGACSEWTRRDNY